MSYQRITAQGKIWIEDQAYTETLVELANAAGERNAKDKEISRLNDLLKAAISAKPTQPAAVIDAPLQRESSTP